MTKKGAAEVIAVFSLLAVIFLCLSSIAYSAESADFFDRSGKRVRLTEGDSADITFSDMGLTVVVTEVGETSIIAYIEGMDAQRIPEGGSTVFYPDKDSEKGVLVQAVEIIGNDVNLRVQEAKRVLPDLASPPETPENGIVKTLPNKTTITSMAVKESPYQPSDSIRRIIIYSLAGLIIIGAFIILVRRSAAKKENGSIKIWKVTRNPAARRK